VELVLLVHLVFVFIFFHFSSKQVSGNELRTFENDELLLVVAPSSGMLKVVGKVERSSAESV
jgi:hypothetical protein